MRFMTCFYLLFSLLINQGCGFQLRRFDTITGMTDHTLPFPNIVIQGNGGVAENLNRQIQMLSRNIKGIVKDKPDTHIILTGEKVEQKILTVNASNQVREYRVYLEQEYRIQYQGETIVEGGFLRIFRDYGYKDSAILGKESEQGMLIQNMYQDAATQILRRTITLVSNIQRKKQNHQDSSLIKPVGQ